MDTEAQQNLRASYDRVAGEYAVRLFDELAHKPLDRQLLDRFAEDVRALGPVCDMGCGPGQIARYLRDKGLEVIGLDLSQGMVEQAQRLNPDIAFRQGDMLALDVSDETWGGIAAFYSILHIPDDAILLALAEMKRTLRTGGDLLLAFHIGQETKHLEEWWGEPVSVDFRFFTPDEMEAFLRAAGFEIVERIERAPYPDVEYPSQRAYIFARKPDANASVG